MVGVGVVVDILIDNDIVSGASVVDKYNGSPNAIPGNVKITSSIFTILYGISKHPQHFFGGGSAGLSVVVVVVVVVVISGGISQ